MEFRKIQVLRTGLPGCSRSSPESLHRGLKTLHLLPGHGSHHCLPDRGQWGCTRSHLQRSPAYMCIDSGEAREQSFISPQSISSSALQEICPDPR